MKQLAFRFFSAAFLVLALCGQASATSSLSFEGGGYWIELEVGYTEQPVIAAVRFFAPGDRKGVVLPSERVVVETFDTKDQVLVLRYSGGVGNVEPFALTVRQQAGLLHIGTRKISAPFRWVP